MNYKAIPRAPKNVAVKPETADMIKRQVSPSKIPSLPHHRGSSQRSGLNLETTEVNQCTAE